MDFEFFNVEGICGFNSTFVAICSATSYPFGFLYINKQITLDILKFLDTKLRNQDEKITFIRVHEDGAPVRYSKLIQTCYNMNIIVQTTYGDSS